MTHPLPSSITQYFAGKNIGDFETALSGFAPDAVVADESHSHQGRGAIGAWMQDTHRRYRDMAEILSATVTEPITTVSARISGNFPGSPITLGFSFTLQDDRITRLEIA